mmetsp:Transcript_68275/g.181792  ORF Transcript_68275/g.181792 Transcript_68275/m.181792 type:complete len:202 (-) Transcript_68275:1192-1797(-)
MPPPRIAGGLRPSPGDAGHPIPLCRAGVGTPTGAWNISWDTNRYRRFLLRFILPLLRGWSNIAMYGVAASPAPGRPACPRATALLALAKWEACRGTDAPWPTDGAACGAECAEAAYPGGGAPWPKWCTGDTLPDARPPRLAACGGVLDPSSPWLGATAVAPQARCTTIGSGVEPDSSDSLGESLLLCRLSTRRLDLSNLSV